MIEALWLFGIFFGAALVGLALVALNDLVEGLLRQRVAVPQPARQVARAVPRPLVPGRLWMNPTVASGRRTVPAGRPVQLGAPRP